MTVRQEGRNPAIDIARGIGMLLVLYGHAVEMFLSPQLPVAGAMFDQWRAIYSFHMPLFFAISGLVYRPKGLRHAVTSSMGLLLVAFLVHVACWLGDVAVMGQPLRWGTVVWPMVLLAGFTSVVVWFLASLALVQLSFFMLQHWSGWKRALLLSVIVAGFLWAQHKPSIYFQASSVLPGLAFYALGYWVTKVGAWRREVYRHWLVPVLVLGATLALAPLNGGCTWDLGARCINRPQGFAVLMTAGQYGAPVLFVLTALAGCFSVVWLSDVLAHLPSRLNGGLAWVGRRSLDLVIINGVVYRFIQPHVAAMSHDQQLAGAIGVSLLLVLGQVAAARVLRPLTQGIRHLAEAIAGRIGQLIFWRPLAKLPGRPDS